jgi:hypothetical protein
MELASLRDGGVPYVITPTPFIYPAFVSIIPGRELNASPPRGNCLPQAKLCLWRI